MSRLATLAGLLACYLPAYLLGWAVAAAGRGWRDGRADAPRTTPEAG